ncbi:uncharacterized protein MEPE_00318 [Melanopsichium pennsylvanicum]|uniref:Uncharacterized protein n=2 Tax=Melanopsichium pennsylvanicum TaxID=63383 RepID=A0AAJ5C2J6_9BASI|nr:conserved hypothetical protein [Melanopsichium pennsylvanicum 4]SNX81613.1 uncharacterized protein MEPE_00318 [Melanopsichium pennsylvanicum]
MVKNNLHALLGRSALIIGLLAFVLVSLSSSVRADAAWQQHQPIIRRSAPTQLPPSVQDAPHYAMYQKQQQQNHIFPRQAASTSDSVTTATYSELPTAATTIDGQPQATTTSDPLLALMPDFAFSMPAQIVVDGINIALISVLVIHLLFTVQYHFPLSRRNFYLQMSSSLMLLISLSVTLHIILDLLQTESQRYPFMFPYIGIQLPPGDESWTKVQEVFFLLMRAITTALIHITHIQFLTLLFPSALEARLILWMLGPLAIINSGMEFTGLADDSDAKTNDLGDAIRNICNSTLTLLYTTALIIWGLLVNRSRAWRAGGGTAAFGGGSVGLALINTAISFTEIKYDRLWWLPNVCWTLTIWQSWLGFWWWVSSGMGIGEVEDRQERLERKRKREERKRRKLEKQKQKLAMLEAADANNVEAHSSQHDSSSIPGLNRLRRIKDRLIGDSTGASILTRRNRRQNVAAIESDATSRPARTKSGSGTDEIELDQICVAARSETEHTQQRDGSPDSIPLTGIAVHSGTPEGEHAADGEMDINAANEDGRTTAGTGSGSSDTNPTSSSAPGWIATAAQRFMDHQPNFIKARFRRLRLAHMAAARRAAHEQTVLREQVLSSSRIAGPGLRHMVFERSGSSRTDIDTNIDVNAMPELSSTLGRSASLGTKPTQDTKTISTTSSLRNVEEPRSQSTDGAIGSSQCRGSINPRSTSSLSTGRQDRINEDEDDGSDSTSLRGSSESHNSLSGRRAANAGSKSPTVSQRNASTRAPAGPSGTATASGAAMDRPASLRTRGSVSGSMRSARQHDNTPADTRDDEWEDVDVPSTAAARRGAAADSAATRNSYARPPITQRSTSRTRRDDDSDDDDAEDSSWFWRGGLRQMRLRDRTTYD